MIHKHEPVSKEAMRYVSPQYTICEVLREIYFKTNDPEIEERCRVATAMAKAMEKRLKQINPKWSKNFFERNPNFDEISSVG